MITKQELVSQLKALGISLIHGQYISESDLQKYLGSKAASNTFEKWFLRGKGSAPLTQEQGKKAQKK
jgi:hypothetical protein